MPCGEKYQYESLKRQCVYNTKACKNVDCATQGPVAPYKPDPQFYIICASGRAEIKRCLDGEKYELDRGGCWYKCAKNGNFKHEDPKMFYNCLAAGAKGVPFECPGNGDFDPVKGQCDLSFLLLQNILEQEINE